MIYCSFVEKYWQVYPFIKKRSNSNPLCILNKADFNVVDISFKDELIDKLHNGCNSTNKVSTKNPKAILRRID